MTNQPQQSSLSIEATHQKLREARFFYDHLMREKRRRVDLDSSRPDSTAEEFGYYFSAFIQAARNVVWVLKSEEKEKWVAWEPVWRASLSTEDLELLEITNKCRLDVVKRRGAPLIMQVEDTATVQEMIISFLAETQDGGSPRLRRVQRRTFYLEAENGKEEVTTLAERYLAFLEKMVQEFKDGHASAPTRF